MNWLIGKLQKVFNLSVDPGYLKSSGTVPDHNFPISPALSLNRGRRRALQVLGLGGGSIGLALLGSRSFAQSDGTKPVQPQQPTDLTTFNFEVVTVNAKGQVVERKPGQARSFTQMIGDIELEMVSIPGGTFMMGQTDSERAVLTRQLDEEMGSQFLFPNNELPQHEVTLAPFFMGKYPVTQAQWRAVAALPRVHTDLSPDISSFKGDNRPVEKVYWFEAMEFCARLSAHTGQPYTLPSEAQWEYACRAGTTTPFHFGETLTTDLANYNGEYTFASGPKGVFRQETTDVGSFSANTWGLYDMHGNVQEWCLDHYRDTYEGAPADGTAVVFEAVFNTDPCILRGGSWDKDPMSCRCASRVGGSHDNRYNDSGFRVLIAPPGTFGQPFSPFILLP